MPLISIITAARNGLPLIERAFRSISQQTFKDWEWLVVDDASTDGTGDAVRAWAAEDVRIRLLVHEENRGTSAARNTALRAARGSVITYLDHDDEYYPDYLGRVRQLRDVAEVLVFGYDMIFDDGEAQGRMSHWDPSKARENFFISCVVTPLGVAHRRDVVERVGGFNELLWHDEDLDLWRRLSRAGTKFAYLQATSGLYHVRSGSVSRTGQPTAHQSETVERNWRAGKPIYGERPWAAAPPRKVRKIAFVSPHSVLDFTNGAATATLDGLTLLARSGFECHAFCCSRMDSWEEVAVEELMAKRGVQYQVYNAQVDTYRGQMTFTSHGQVAVTLFNSASTRGGWSSNEEAMAFLSACNIFLTKNRPDVIWTYGGDPVSQMVQQLAKQLDIPIVFALHNFAYQHSGPFQWADYVVVPTEFCRQYYWDKLGLAALKLPLVVDPERVLVNNGPQADPHLNPLPVDEEEDVSGTLRVPIDSGTRSVPDTEYVTFVNPEPRKGVFVFARIAEVLSQQRPEISLLIVEGSAKAKFLPQLGIDLSGVRNLRIMPNVPEARAFYAVTKMFVMPSLVEPAGLVAMEAMMNGIPVLASKRDGLPEVVGEAGLLFDIPARYTHETRDIPTAEEVEPWVESIVHLWDDAAEYDRWSRAARERAQQWHPDRLAPVYCDFFSQLTHQPAAPLVPKRS